MKPIQKMAAFSTPVSDYQAMNGMNLIAYGEAVWHYTDTAFTYGKFNTQKIEYNVISVIRKK